MKNKKEIPKSLASRPDKKSARANIAQTDNKPSWRFSTVDKNGLFAWPTGDSKELDIVGKLHNFDSMEWSEIVGSDHHAIPVKKLSKEAQDRLIAIQQDDIDEVFSFHLQGKPRIICIRDRDIAKLLWYDPEHKVCPSNKKHT